MIKKLIIENFQSHKYTEIDFSSGVNVIVGPTDNGKSSIVRAIHWLFFNKPSGDAFRRRGSDLTRVYAELESGNILIREKSKSVNRYLLNDTEFRAIGQNPPEEILKAHGLTRDLNFSMQGDSFFLLQNSPGQVAQYFNRVAGIDDIDKAIRNINQKKNEVLTRVNNLELLKGLNQDKIGLIPDVSQLENLINDCEQIQKQIDKLVSMRNPIIDVWKRYKNRQRFPLTKRLKKCKKIMGNIVAIKADIISQNKTKNKLRNLQGRLEQNSKLVAESDIVFKLADELKQAVQVKKWIEATEEKQKAISKIWETISGLDQVLEETERELKKTVKKMPDKCPLCGSKTTNHKH